VRVNVVRGQHRACESAIRTHKTRLTGAYRFRLLDMQVEHRTSGPPAGRPQHDAHKKTVTRLVAGSDRRLPPDFITRSGLTEFGATNRSGSQRGPTRNASQRRASMSSQVARFATAVLPVFRQRRRDRILVTSGVRVKVFVEDPLYEKVPFRITPNNGGDGGGESKVTVCSGNATPRRLMGTTCHRAAD